MAFGGVGIRHRQHCIGFSGTSFDNGGRIVLLSKRHQIRGVLPILEGRCKPLLQLASQGNHRTNTSQNFLATFNFTPILWRWTAFLTISVGRQILALFFFTTTESGRITTTTPHFWNYYVPYFMTRQTASNAPFELEMTPLRGVFHHVSRPKLLNPLNRTSHSSSEQG